MSYILWLRERLGRRKIILVYGCVVAWDDQGRILMQRRTDFDRWGLPGGILEPGETILACTRRELLEETGLTAGHLRLVGIYTDPRYDAVYPNGDQVQQFTVCFSGQLNGGTPRPDGDETSALAYFQPTELPLAELPNFYQDMLHDALNGGPARFEPPAALAQREELIPAIRQRIGNAPYIGAGAVTAVVREDGRLLLIQRQDDGHWDLPGGFLQLGENAAHAAIREVREETGLQVQLERLLGVFSPAQPWVYPNGDQTQSTLAVFRARPSGGSLAPQRSEVRRLAWLTPAEVLALPAPPLVRQELGLTLQHLSQGVFVT